MEEKPRKKAKTSSAVKRRYNEKMYTRMEISSVPKEKAARFKALVAQRGESVSGVLNAAIDEYLARYD